MSADTSEVRQDTVPHENAGSTKKTTTGHTTNYKRRKSIDDMNQLAAKQGGRCLSAEYINAKTNLKWVCSHGHTFFAKPGNITSGRWCKTCWALKRTFDALIKRIDATGGKVLSSAYMGPGIKLRFRCAAGHTSSLLADTVKKKNWCPACKKNSAKNSNRAKSKGR